MKELEEQPINLQQLEAALHRINDFNRMIENSSGFNKSLHKYACTFTKGHSKK